jgi:hypothetical protein
MRRVPDEMENTPNLDERSRDILIQRIRVGKVTPFIGAGAGAGTLPTGAELAREWSTAFGYPHGMSDDLTAVAQYLAVTHGSAYPKHVVAEQLEGKGPPDFTHPLEPHAFLAALDLPIYITTNYDDFMVQALRDKGKDPIQDFCRWNADVRTKGDQSVFDRPGFEPTPEQPVVFHLHGIREVPASIVITEDDYLRFIVDVSWHHEQLLPVRIKQALTGASLMFMGYSLEDLDFKVIFQAIVIGMESELRRKNVSVQLPREEKAVASYLAEYLRMKNIEVYWGDLEEFVDDLRQGLATPSPSTRG